MDFFFPEEIIEEIKEKNDIVEVISQYTKLDSAGSSYKALCPFHNEKTPSFMVNREKQFFKCFGCGEGGDVIGFIMKIENLDFIDALKLLADRVNINLDKIASSKEIRKRQDANDKYYEINKIAGRYFYDNLVRDRNPAIDYILKRQITPATVKTFGLGYALNSWDDLLDYLKGKGYTEQDIEQAGLIVKGKQKNTYYNRFRNRLMFPIFDIRGRVMGFGGRVLDESMPKYLNSPETKIFNKSKTLYGLNIARRNNRKRQLILVEGYMDVLVLYQYGFTNTVATLGTSLTKDHGHLLKRYFDQIILCFDGDQAGRKASLRSIRILDDIVKDIKVVNLPKDKDPDDYVRENGKEKFKDIIGEALTAVDYKIYLARKKYKSNTIDDQINFAREIVNIVKDIASPVEQEAYIKQIERKYGLSKSAIMREIYGGKKEYRPTAGKYSSNARRDNRYIQVVPLGEERGYILAARQLIKYMLTNTQGIANIVSRIKKDHFVMEDHREIFEYILTSIEKKQTMDGINTDLAKLENEIGEILAIDIEEIDIDKVVDKYETNSKRYKLLNRRESLKDKQKKILKEENLTKGEVEKQLLKLGEQMMEINIELQNLQTEEGREQNE